MLENNILPPKVEEWSLISTYSSIKCIQKTVVIHVTSSCLEIKENNVLMKENSFTKP